MKAMMIPALGSEIEFQELTLDDPAPGPGQVLISVRAASINVVDTKIRGGMDAIAPDDPIVLGCDVAGTVLAVGEGVERFAVGDKVYGCAGGIKGSGGAYATMMVADARLLAPMPANLDFKQSAALPLVAITAWEALVDRAKVAPGEKVLIHGGTGGVGHIAIQLAKALGAIVHATVSTQEKADIALKLGADEVFLYPELSVADYVESGTAGAGYDVVFDTVGGDNIAPSLDAIAINGRCVTIVSLESAPDLSPLHVKNATLHVVFMLIPLLTGVGREAHGRILEKLANMVEAGMVAPLIDETVFALSDVGAAHDRLLSGKAIGKVVVEVS
ncbi:MAG: zinc-dependent alcohol dehydrogenase family protein [Alphaproteobacteria bacterium]|nr:zinc-dependent alcohol dehydrogenase family protein [Alphaproteobacteria bacterium]